MCALSEWVAETRERFVYRQNEMHEHGSDVHRLVVVRVDVDADVDVDGYGKGDSPREVVKMLGSDVLGGDAEVRQ